MFENKYSMFHKNTSKKNKQFINDNNLLFKPTNFEYYNIAMIKLVILMEYYQNLPLL